MGVPKIVAPKIVVPKMITRGAPLDWKPPYRFVRAPKDLTLSILKAIQEKIESFFQAACSI